MVVPITYRKSSEAAVSYDYFDLSARTGYKTFYGIVTNEGKGLIVSRIDSNKWRTGYTGSVGSPYATFDYDLEFNAPNAVKGYLFVTMSYEVKSGDATSTSVYITATISKVDKNAVVTTIGATLTGDTITSPTSATQVAKRATMQFSIPLTHFSIGEKLRVSIAHFGTGDGGAAGIHNFYHDPGSRSTTDYNETTTGAKAATDLIINVPFRVDL